MKKCYLLLLASLYLGSNLLAQGPKRPPVDTTASKPAPKPAAGGIKPYSEIITAKAKTSNGLFRVHKVEDRYLFEIADSLLNRDILVVNRISKAAADSRVQTMGYAGDEIGENVVRFEKGPN